MYDDLLHDAPDTRIDWTSPLCINYYTWWPTPWTYQVIFNDTFWVNLWSNKHYICN